MLKATTVELAKFGFKVTEGKDVDSISCNDCGATWEWPHNEPVSSQVLNVFRQHYNGHVMKAKLRKVK